MTNKELKKLVLDLHKWQRYARVQWHYAQADFDLTYGFMLLNWYGEVTAMPTYAAYTQTWKSAGVESPFEFNWLKYRAESHDIHYIDLVRDTIQEQCNMWGVCEETRTCFSYGLFQTFADRLERLYEYLDFYIEGGRTFIKRSEFQEG